MCYPLKLKAPSLSCSNKAVEQSAYVTDALFLGLFISCGRQRLMRRLSCETHLFFFFFLLFSFNQCQLEAKAHSVISAHYHCMDTEKQTSSFSRLSFSLFSLFAMPLFNCCTAPSGCCVYMCTNLRHHWSCALFLWAFLLFAVFPGVWLASHFKSMLLFLV